MNRKFFITAIISAVGIGILILTGSLLATAECPHKKAEGMHDCPCKMEGISFNVTNIEKGVKIEMTADKPELVKKIQEHAKMESEMKAEAKDAKTMECPHKKAEAAKHEGCACKCPCKVEGAVKKVTNTDNGVVIEITAEKAEAIKEIQDTAAKMHEKEAAQTEIKRNSN